MKYFEDEMKKLLDKVKEVKKKNKTFFINCINYTLILFLYFIFFIIIIFFIRYYNSFN